MFEDSQECVENVLADRIMHWKGLECAAISATGLKLGAHGVLEGSPLSAIMLIESSVEPPITHDIRAKSCDSNMVWKLWQFM